MERESDFVRFHSMQSIVLHVVTLGITVVAAFLSVLLAASMFIVPVGGIVGFGLLGLIGIGLRVILLIFAIIAMVKAYRYEVYRIPLVGRLAQALMRTFDRN